jgi:phage baseplate assembly protein W
MMSDFLGKGLMRPFQRDGKGDFASGEGATLVGSVLGQVLGTRAVGGSIQGEIPWRPDAGSRLYLLLHKGNQPILRELAAAYVQEAIERWEPRVEVLNVVVDEPETLAEQNQIVIRTTWRLIAVNVANNQVYTTVTKV